MNTKYDGGPAFPVLRPSDPRFEYCDGGMTLRDYFAGQALAGILASANVGNSPDDLAQACFGIADAMLAARQGGAE